MSKYIVFKCTKCGKTGIHELRTNQSKKNYYLSCKFCGKKSNYLNAVVYKVFDLPQDATLLMNQINLGKIKALPVDEAEKLILLGVDFMSREQKKISQHDNQKKVSIKEILHFALEELQEFSQDELEEHMGEQNILIEEFEKHFETLRKTGAVIQTSPDHYRYIPD